MLLSTFMWQLYRNSQLLEKNNEPTNDCMNNQWVKWLAAVTSLAFFFHFPLHTKLPVFPCWRKCQQLHWHRQTNFSPLSSRHDVVYTRTPQILPQVLPSVIKSKNSGEHQLFCCYCSFFCFPLTIMQKSSQTL